MKKLFFILIILISTLFISREIELYSGLGLYFNKGMGFAGNVEFIYPKIGNSPLGFGVNNYATLKIISNVGFSINIIVNPELIINMGDNKNFGIGPTFSFFDKNETNKKLPFGVNFRYSDEVNGVLTSWNCYLGFNDSWIFSMGTGFSL